MRHSVAYLSLLVASMAFADEPYVTAEATAEVAIVDSVERAEGEAREAALRDVVAQVGGLELSSQTEVRNNQLVRDRIVAQAFGYVRKLEVVAKRREKNVVFVTVRAEVGKSQLDKDVEAVRALVEWGGNRRLVVMLQEQTTNSETKLTTSSGVLSAALAEAFRNDGWTLVDPSFAAGKVRLAPGSVFGTPEARELGELSKAEYILYGTVNFRQVLPTTTFPPVRDDKGRQLLFYVEGDYELSLFATDNGVQLARAAGQLVGDEKRTKVTVSYERSASDIARLHAPRIVAEMRHPVVEHLRRSQVNGTRVTLTVLGFDDVTEADELKGKLKALARVKGLSPGVASRGKAVFDVVYEGTSEQLAKDIGAFKSFKKRKLAVTGRTGNTVEISVGR